MRVSKRKDGDFYSPDDHDTIGFTALVKKWVEENQLPYRDKDVEEFCHRWSSYNTVSLRNKKQWLNELYEFINCEVRYR